MILDEIKEIMMINDIDITEDELTESMQLIEDLGLDSLDFAKLISSIEEKYDIKINNHQIDKIITIEDLINCIENNINMCNC